MISREPDSEDGLLTTGEMARRSNTTLRTVRFYEEAGILRPEKRSLGGHRLFAPSELERLELVTDLRAVGFSLEEIKALLEVKAANATGGGAAEDLSSRLARHIEELERRLEVLGRLRTDLAGTQRVTRGCAGCKDQKFPEHCDACAVIVKEGAELPRAARVLWSVRCEGGKR